MPSTRRAHGCVWNHFSSSLSVVDTSAGSVITNLPVFDPTPDIVRQGRHLTTTSGLGIVSCASCHVDARFDRLAWDLGDPAGAQLTNGGFGFHPMKGPMVTQTFRTSSRRPTSTGAHSPISRCTGAAIEGHRAVQSHARNLLSNDRAHRSRWRSSRRCSQHFLPASFCALSPTVCLRLPLPGQFGRVPTNGEPPACLTRQRAGRRVSIWKRVRFLSRR